MVLPWLHCRCDEIIIILQMWHDKRVDMVVKGTHDHGDHEEQPKGGYSSTVRRHFIFWLLLLFRPLFVRYQKSRLRSRWYRWSMMMIYLFHTPQNLHQIDHWRRSVFTFSFQTTASPIQAVIQFPVVVGWWLTLYRILYSGVRVWSQWTSITADRSNVIRRNTTTTKGVECAFQQDVPVLGRRCHVRTLTRRYEYRNDLRLYVNIFGRPRMYNNRTLRYKYIYSLNDDNQQSNDFT